MSKMLARSRRRGHVHCDCHDRGSHRRARQNWRWSHKKSARAAEKRLWKREV